MVTCRRQRQKTAELKLGTSEQAGRPARIEPHLRYVGVAVPALHFLGGGRPPLPILDQNSTRGRKKQYGGFSKNLTYTGPYDPAIPPLGIYPKGTESTPGTDACTPLFIAAFFAIARMTIHR